MAHELIDVLAGWFFGYDPGGNNRHGVAAIRVAHGRVQRSVVATKQTVADVLNWFQCQPQEWNERGPLSGVFGMGIDTLAYWCGASNGAREADRWLGSRYDGIMSSVIWPNALRSAMSINGMFVLRELRRNCPSLYVTETHPKVLYYALSETPRLKEINRRIEALTGRRDAAEGKRKKEINTEIKSLRNQRQEKGEEGLPFTNQWLLRVLVTHGEASTDHARPDNPHEWDALISAWAAYRGYESAQDRGDWKNLVDCDSASDLDFPAESVEYRWPGEKEVAAVKERLRTLSD